MLTVFAGPLGLWLAVGGLFIRLFGSPLAEGGILGVWQALPSALGLPIEAAAWPMVVVGTGWLGALAGLWLRLGWARRAALVLAFASLIFLGPGTAAGAVALACLTDRRLRSWLVVASG